MNPIEPASDEVIKAILADIEYSKPCSCDKLDATCVNPRCSDVAKLCAMIRDLQNSLAMAGAILEWIRNIVDGNEVSDLAMSYGIVRDVAYLKYASDEFAKQAVPSDVNTVDRGKLFERIAELEQKRAAYLKATETANN